MKTTLLTGFLIASFSILATAQDVKSHYKIVNRIKVAGDLGWDYCAVDEDADVLYVSHGTKVDVIDLKTSKELDSIPNTRGVHGIAIAHDLNKGFISAGKDTAAVVFDLKTHKEIARIKTTGNNPDAIFYETTTQRVFTFNGKSSNATVIDAKTNTVVGTIALDGKPEFCVSDGKGILFVNIEDKSEIAEIDASTMKVLKEWSVAPGEGPSGLAIDQKNHKLFSVCDKMMVISDAEKGVVVANVAIGDGPDAVTFDPEKMRIYSSNSDGTMTVVSDSANTYKVLENVTTQRRARTMAINTKTHHLYLPVADFMPLHPARVGAEKQKPTPKPGTFVVLDIETED